MKKLIPFIAPLLFGLPVLAQDADMFPADSRIRILPYDESDIYTIPTKYGYQTHIIFAPDEVISAISMGDRSMWQIIPSGNRLFIRPMHEDVLTNMTVITSKRSYQFDIKSVSAESKNTSIVYVARFVYPDPEQETLVSPYDEQIENVGVSLAQPPAVPATAPDITPAMPAAQAPVYPAPQPVIPAVTAATGHNTRYTFAGPDELAPLQVYDDGKSTYFKYRDMGQPLPNAYVMESGREKPVGHYIKDGFMIIDEVAGEWVLKSSAGTIIVYNETLNPQ